MKISCLVLLFLLFSLGQTLKAQQPYADRPYVERVNPSPEWILWWHEAEECIGQKLDINEITFYVVNDTVFVAEWKLHISWSDPVAREVYLVADLTGNKTYMQHVFAHQFLNKRGHPDHPFKTCGWNIFWTIIDGVRIIEFESR